MTHFKASTSSNFKKTTIKAIFSIVLFVISYLALIIMAISLTVLCGFAGIGLISWKPAIYTLMLGLGLFGMGIMIMVFLFRFLFQKHTPDLSHLIEIKQEEQPKLFALIKDVVDTVKTDFPQKIYLSGDVNASVFYDSSFWSMFMPIKKNLQIGLGLVNSVSEAELKAILGHEFGHFSQRSMKVGSYVYNVNNIIFNMLYNNTSYNEMLESWGNMSGYFKIFSSLSTVIVNGIQWVLKKNYAIINISYMSLSREMEFHADEVAAYVTGPDPLITSLLRLDLANRAYTEVLNYYNSKIQDCIITNNIYPQQLFVMNLIAQHNNLTSIENLPQVNEDNKFSASKIEINNQWASHPSTKDRILKLKKISVPAKTDNHHNANVLFNNIDDLQITVTEQLFKTVTYKEPVKNYYVQEFISEYEASFKSNTFNSIFNNYYDNVNPLPVTDLSIEEAETMNFTELYSDKSVKMANFSISIQNDVELLKRIINKEIVIKNFEYDGKKYASNRAAEILQSLTEELNKVKIAIDVNNTKIYTYFNALADQKGKGEKYRSISAEFFEYNAFFDEKLISYNNIIKHSAFTQTTTTFDVIEANLSELKKAEVFFKQDINEIMNHPAFSAELTIDIKNSFDKYLSEEQIYFTRPKYNHDNIELLFSSINNFYILLSGNYFNKKKQLLNFNASLLQEEKVLASL